MAALEELYALVRDGAITARLATPSQTSSPTAAAAATDCLTWLYDVCLAQVCGRSACFLLVLPTPLRYCVLATCLSPCETVRAR
jgi:hypothetical protein